MSKDKYFVYDHIYFEHGNIPFKKKHADISLSSNDAITREKFLQAIWPEYYSFQQKNNLINHVIKDVYVTTSARRLVNIFGFSVLERLLDIVISSLKLRLDNENLKPIYKNIAHFALSAVIPGILIFVAGYPATDIILNTAIQQASSVVLSTASHAVGYCSQFFESKFNNQKNPFFSAAKEKITSLFKKSEELLHWGSNYIRSLELISNNKIFAPLTYALKLLLTSILDCGISFYLHGAELINDPLKVKDSFHTFKFSTNQYNPGTLIFSHITSSAPLISIADKFTKIAARIVVDTAIVTANKFNLVADIRSPFINAFKNDQKPVINEDFEENDIQPKLKPASQHKPRFVPVNPRSGLLKKRLTNTDSEDTAVDKTSVITNTTQPEIPMDFFSDERRFIKAKVKTRSNTACLSTEIKEPNKDTAESFASTAISIRGLKYYPVSKDNIIFGFAVIDTHKVKNDTDKYEKRLKNNGRIGDKQAIEMISKNTANLRG
jgi:hypothetical protein